MIGLRLPVAGMPGREPEAELWIEDHEFEAWVRSGRVTPATLVWAGDLSGGQWKPAEDLEVFHLFRPEAVAPVPPEFSLRETIFPPRGFSATELLLSANILVAVGLLAAWRDGYSAELVQTMSWWHRQVAARGEVWRFLPTIFMHADAGHLARNLAALLVTAGAVEVFYGRRMTWAIYLVTGVVAAVVSYLGHGRPPLSVGASGAIFGLAGVVTTFLWRHHRKFSDRQRWKAGRVYAPLLLFLVPPSLVNADWMAHMGGYAAGLLLGLVAPLGRRGRELTGAPGS